MFTNNNQSNKGGVTLYIKNSIPVMVKSKQTFIRNGIEPISNGTRRSVDISTENFYIAREEIISSHDPNIKTYILGDFNINLLDYFILLYQ